MRASDVTPRPVEWLWHPYVPLGKITVLAGQMGQGKSLATTWLAAAVTTGNDIGCQRGSVVMLSGEDDPEDTQRPRLEAAGADLGRVWLDPTPTIDVGNLDRLCREAGDVRLVTIDPIAGYLGGAVNTWKASDVRQALDPLRRLAQQHRFAAVLVQHLNRRTDSSDALGRIADSQGVTQLARSVLVWGPDPADADGDRGARKVLTRAKGNLSRSPASATFTITEQRVTGGITAPTLSRGDDITLDAEDVVADHDTRTATDEAVAWLKALLADGPVAAKDGNARAREVGIADRTLKRARQRLGVQARQGREDGKVAGWTWELPDIGGGLLDTVGPLGPLDQEANKANKANNSKRATGPHAAEEAIR